MQEKTVLITGASAGIGLAGAEALAREGWTILVHARNDQRGGPVVEALTARYPLAQFHLVTGDLADLRQVAALSEQVRALTPVLDVLWSNAGVFLTQPRTSTDGFEYQWAVNHLAPQALITALLPLLQAAPQGRIIQTSSFAHRIGQVPGPGGFDVPGDQYNGWKTYGDTKLGNVLMVKELAKRLANTPVTAHAFHPGYVKTTIGSNGDLTKGNASSWLSLFQVSVEKGAETGVFLARDDQPGTASGQYWSNRRLAGTNRRATAENAALLWNLTEEAIKKAVP